MSNDRIAIKQKLLLSRQEFRAGTQQRLFCDLCDTAQPSDLHEVLIERDDVKGPELMKIVTEAEQNLQLLCNPCNIGPAKESKNHDRLIAKQIMRFGRLWLREQKIQVMRDMSPAQRNNIVAVIGTEVLSRWVESIGMTNPSPYVARVEIVGDSLLIGDVYAKKAPDRGS